MWLSLDLPGVGNYRHTKIWFCSGEEAEGGVDHALGDFHGGGVGLVGAGGFEGVDELDGEVDVGVEDHAVGAGVGVAGLEALLEGGIVLADLVDVDAGLGGAFAVGGEVGGEDGEAAAVGDGLAVGVAGGVEV